MNEVQQLRAENRKLRELLEQHGIQWQREPEEIQEGILGKEPVTAQIIVGIVSEALQSNRIPNREPC